MWIPESLPMMLRSLRKELRLSQEAVAQAAGVSQQKVSELERGVSSGTRETLVAICRVLAVDVGEVMRRTAWEEGQSGRPNRERERRLEESYAPPGLYIPECERSFAQRVHACRQQNPHLTERRESELSRRGDVQELSKFLADVATDSRIEALHLLAFCCAGAHPATLPPARMGCGPIDIYDWKSKRYVGHCRMRALALEELGFTVVLWPQVPVRVKDKDGKTHHFRVDGLAGLLGPKGPVWAVVEVDGDGHDSEGDRGRSHLLGLPVLRFQQGAVLRDDYPLVLTAEIKKLYSEHAFSLRRRLVGQKPPHSRGATKAQPPSRFAQVGRRS